MSAMGAAFETSPEHEKGCRDDLKSAGQEASPRFDPGQIESPLSADIGFYDREDWDAAHEFLNSHERHEGRERISKDTVQGNHQTVPLVCRSACSREQALVVEF